MKKYAKTLKHLQQKANFILFILCFISFFSVWSQDKIINVSDMVINRENMLFLSMPDTIRSYQEKKVPNYSYSKTEELKGKKYLINYVDYQIANGSTVKIGTYNKKNVNIFVLKFISKDYNYSKAFYLKDNIKITFIDAKKNTDKKYHQLIFLAISEKLNEYFSISFHEKNPKKINFTIYH